MDSDDASESNAGLTQQFQRLQQQFNDLARQCELQSDRIAEVERQNAELLTSNGKLAAENAALAAKVRELTERNGTEMKRKTPINRRNRTIPTEQRTLGAFGFGGSHTVSSLTDDSMNDSPSGGRNNNGTSVTANGDASAVNDNNGTYVAPNGFVSIQDGTEDDANLNAQTHNVCERPLNVSDDNGWNVVTTKSQRKNKAANQNSKTKVTPIQLEKMDAASLGSLSSRLSTMVGRDDVFVQRLGNGKHPRIFCKNESVKSSIMECLNADNVQYNSFNNPETRRKAFIVRGLCYPTHGEAIDAITCAITALGIVDDVTVSHFETAYQRHHPDDDRSPLYRVVVGSAVNDQTLLDVRTIGFFGVRIEKMKKSLVVQCHNCQRYHHTTGQCHFKYRCVQCISAHEHGECPRLNNRALPIGCVNCADNGLNGIGHTANDLRNCNYFKGLGGSSAGNRANVSVKPTNTVESAVRPPTAGSPPGSYAHVLKSAVASRGTTALDANQLARIATAAVQSVLAALLNGS